MCSHVLGSRSAQAFETAAMKRAAAVAGSLEIGDGKCRIQLANVSLAKTTSTSSILVSQAVGPMIRNNSYFVGLQLRRRVPRSVWRSKMLSSPLHPRSERYKMLSSPLPPRPWRARMLNSVQPKTLRILPKPRWIPMPMSARPVPQAPRPAAVLFL